MGHRAPQDADGPISEVWSLDRREPDGEDCLTVNVFTPGPGGRRPVMVWLHGGGFSGGSGNWLLYDGTNLARKEDVVVVAVNHRLNLFGFLHLADLGGEKWANSSNAGMQDIVAALVWTRDNISGFGGDPGTSGERRRNAHGWVRRSFFDTAVVHRPDAASELRRAHLGCRSA